MLAYFETYAATGVPNEDRQDRQGALLILTLATAAAVVLTWSMFLIWGLVHLSSKLANMIAP